MNVVIGDNFVWHSDIRTLKPSFLNKQILYISLARMDSDRNMFIHAEYKPVGTLLFRYYMSNVACQSRCVDLKHLHRSWFNNIPLQDFYRFIQ